MRHGWSILALVAVVSSSACKESIFSRGGSTRTTTTSSGADATPGNNSSPGPFEDIEDPEYDATMTAIASTPGANGTGTPGTGNTPTPGNSQTATSVSATATSFSATSTSVSSTATVVANQTATAVATFGATQIPTAITTGTPGPLPTQTTTANGNECTFVETFSQGTLQYWQEISHTNGGCGASSLAGGALRWSCPNNKGKGYLHTGCIPAANSIVHMEADVTYIGKTTDTIPGLGLLFGDNIRWGQAYQFAYPSSFQNNAAIYNSHTDPMTRLAFGGSDVTTNTVNRMIVDITPTSLNFIVSRGGTNVANLTSNNTAWRGKKLGIFCSEAECRFDNISIRVVTP